MKTIKCVKKVGATLTAVLALTLSTTTVVYANNNSDISSIVEEAQSNVGIKTELSVKLLDDTQTNIATSEDGTINVSTDSLENLKITSVESNGALVIPDSNASEIEIKDGIAISSSDTNQSVKYAISPFEDGNVKVHSVLEDKSAPESYEYQFPGVDSIIIDGETGVAFLFKIDGEDYNLVGGIDKPWAVDAKGVEVPTRFEARGNTLIQVVEHKAGNYAYPITADPSWWDSVSGWFKNSGSYIVGKAKSAANWLGRNSKWLAGKTWNVTKRYGPRGAKFLGKKIGPWAPALCLVGGTWAWYRSDATGWVRVGDALEGCFL